MPDEASRQWIVEPPAPGEVTFHVAVGEGVDLTEEQERALSEFVRSLEQGDAEVTGHATAGKCSAYAHCTDKTCKPVRCTVFDCDVLKSGLTAGSGQAWSLMGTIGPPA